MPEFNTDTETIIEIAELDALRAANKALAVLLADLYQLWTEAEIDGDGLSDNGLGVLLNVRAALSENGATNG